MSKCPLLLSLLTPILPLVWIIAIESLTVLLLTSARLIFPKCRTLKVSFCSEEHQGHPFTSNWDSSASHSGLPQHPSLYPHLPILASPSSRTGQSLLTKHILGLPIYMPCANLQQWLPPLPIIFLSQNLLESSWYKLFLIFLNECEAPALQSHITVWGLEHSHTSLH